MQNTSLNILLCDLTDYSISVKASKPLLSNPYLLWISKK